MQQDIVEKLHQEKYQTMSLQEYTKVVTHGLKLIRNSGLFAKDSFSSKAINLALEYNMELMVKFLGADKLVPTGNEPGTSIRHQLSS
jgi:hypothetical protein